MHGPHPVAAVRPPRAAASPTRPADPRRLRLAIAATGLSVMVSGAMFGFFYAWVTSTMWGLDAIDPRVAIAAMQGMNASVRNPAFGVAFFGTPAVTALAAGLALWAAERRAAGLLAAACAAYTLAALLPTLTVNVPMNQALAALSVPQDRDAAAAIWTAWSPRWQGFNLIRTLAAGTTLALAAAALMVLGRGPHPGRGWAQPGRRPDTAGAVCPPPGREDAAGRAPDAPV